MPWLKGHTLPAVDNSVDKVDNSANRRFFSHSGAIIGLFAKEPVPGRVKTRLTPQLTPEQACRLYTRALQETVAMLQSTGAALVLCYAGERAWFEQNYPGLPLLAQQGENLGMRMANAVGELFDAGGGPVLLSGSDNPDLPVTFVRQVVARLQDVDVATVPCRDGGYAVVGLRRPTTEVFAEIPWSTEQVLSATRRRCQELGLTYFETEAWSDLDELDDLRLLVKRSPHSTTAQYVVRELGELLGSTGEDHGLVG